MSARRRTMKLTSEYFESVGLTISQPRKGCRYGEDSLAFADFVKADTDDRIAELGSGVAVISLLIAARHKPQEIIAVEIQDELHKIAVKNTRENKLSNAVRCIHDDYRRFAKFHPRSFDLVISNPPFHPPQRGRISPNPQRAAAHHEICGTIADLIKAARTILKPMGRLALIYSESRRKELIKIAMDYGFIQSRTRTMSRGRKRSPTFLVEFEIHR